MSNVTHEQGLARLLALADLLDKADTLHQAKGEPTYFQGDYMHGCGTPACAIGHWAVANPGRWRFVNGYPLMTDHGDLSAGWWQNCVLEDAAAEFEIDDTEAEELFCGVGCGNAQTAKEAADYIRAFVARARSKRP